MLYLRVTGFRTGSDNGIFRWSFRDEFGHWEPMRATDLQIGIETPIEMSDRKAVTRALRLLGQCVHEHRAFLREASVATEVGHLELIGREGMHMASIRLS